MGRSPRGGGYEQPDHMCCRRRGQCLGRVPPALRGRWDPRPRPRLSGRFAYPLLGADPGPAGGRPGADRTAAERDPLLLVDDRRPPGRAGARRRVLVPVDARTGPLRPGDRDLPRAGLRFLRRDQRASNPADGDRGNRGGGLRRPRRGHRGRLAAPRRRRARAFRDLPGRSSRGWDRGRLERVLRRARQYASRPPHLSVPAPALLAGSRRQRWGRRSLDRPAGHRSSLAGGRHLDSGRGAALAVYRPPFAADPPLAARSRVPRHGDPAWHRFYRRWP